VTHALLPTPGAQCHGQRYTTRIMTQILHKRTHTDNTHVWTPALLVSIWLLGGH